MHGPVIRGWLVELMRRALREETDFAKLSTYVEDTGEVKRVVEWLSRKTFRCRSRPRRKPLSCNTGISIHRRQKPTRCCATIWGPSRASLREG